MSVFGDTCHVRSKYGASTEQVRCKSRACFLLNIMNRKSKGNEICHLILQNDSFPEVPLVEMGSAGKPFVRDTRPHKKHRAS